MPHIKQQVVTYPELWFDHTFHKLTHVYLALYDILGQFDQIQIWPVLHYRAHGSRGCSWKPFCPVSLIKLSKGHSCGLYSHCRSIESEGLKYLGEPWKWSWCRTDWYLTIEQNSQKNHAVLYILLSILTQMLHVFYIFIFYCPGSFFATLWKQTLCF